MAKVNVTIPPGTRDFPPEIVRKRNYIFTTIRNVFELYGFQPLETPAMENIDTLMGKYGEEGDKLIFKILNNGLDNPSKAQQARNDFDQILLGKNTKGITERALRYDLTIPFARFVAMNYGQLTLPFKRYQLQPVWRADRPQKGRYREFYQCDADVVGSNSLLHEIEFTGICDEVFTRLGLNDYKIKVNHRKLLAGIAEAIGATDKALSMTIALDKFEKAGWDGVQKELEDKGFTAAQTQALGDFILAATKSKEDTISLLKSAPEKFLSNHHYAEALDQIDEVLTRSKIINPRLSGGQDKSKIAVDVTLARGLNYYTGMIFEVKPTSVTIGSIAGGGRYDDLTGLFGVPNVPGVGISFGVDRIYDVMEELKLFPMEVYAGTRVLFFNLGDEESMVAMELAQALRQKNVSCEVYHEPAKFDKQFRYAEKKNIPFVAIIGEEEIQSGLYKVKQLATGRQSELSREQFLEFSFKSGR